MAERKKVCAWIQGRPGPNRAIPSWFVWVPVLGPFLRKLGVFHLMADGLKFLFKEDLVPGQVNKLYFVLAPILAMIPALTTVTVVPFGRHPGFGRACCPANVSQRRHRILAVILRSVRSEVYSVILAGWAVEFEVLFSRRTCGPRRS